LDDLTAEVFEFFKDGKWHTLEDVQETFSLDYSAANQIIKFLADSRLIRLSADGSQAVIDHEVLQILQSESESHDSPPDNARSFEAEGSD
jgi:hypothetical protein